MPRGLTRRNLVCPHPTVPIPGNTILKIQGVNPARRQRSSAVKMAELILAVLQEDAIESWRELALDCKVCRVQVRRCQRIYPARK
jgi:hypothetical protein